MDDFSIFLGKPKDSCRVREMKVGVLLLLLMVAESSLALQIPFLGQEERMSPPNKI